MSDEEKEGTENNSPRIVDSRRYEGGWQYDCNLDRAKAWKTRHWSCGDVLNGMGCDDTLKR